MKTYLLGQLFSIVLVLLSAILIVICVFFHFWAGLIPAVMVAALNATAIYLSWKKRNDE
jgi:hypothetical protein